MSRAIKFRVWDGDQMVSPDYIRRDGFACWKENSIPASSDKVMQFTGLYDCTGKEIYVGDIVQNGISGSWVVQPLEGGSFSLRGVCTKYKDSFFLISALNRNVEIIGNIYESPELLEVPK